VTVFDPVAESSRLGGQSTWVVIYLTDRAKKPTRERPLTEKEAARQKRGKRRVSASSIMKKGVLEKC